MPRFTRRQFLESGGFAALARCSSASPSIPHRLLADRAISRLLDNPEHLKSIKGAFGAEFIRNFLARRMELAIRINHKE